MRARRRGLVLGAGGALGFTWTVGALTALQESLGCDVRDMDVIVGTSAGSIMAATLANDVPIDMVLRHQKAQVRPGDFPIDWSYDNESVGPLPPWPTPGLGSPRLLAHVARHPRRFPPVAAAAALLPRGRGSLAPVGHMVERIGMQSWPERETWIVTMDYETGKRTVFGQPGSRSARLSEAVMASCAIPGWYAPVTIGGRRYVDGGTCSSTSLDLLAGSGLDEVYVVAPMAARGFDRPWSPAARVERQFRRSVTRRLHHEAHKVIESGTEVTVLAPGPADLRAIGSNLMDQRRRREVLDASLSSTRQLMAHRLGEQSA